MFGASVFLILIYVSASTSTVVTWLPNKSFNLPINFKDGKLPCPGQTVVFPENPLESIKIESQVAVSGLVLPNNGEIDLVNAEVVFGAEEHTNCTEKGNAMYLPRSTSSWAQPDVWSSPRFNEATPDAERVPCFSDEVVFPSASQFTIYMPKETQRIRGLKINGRGFNNEQFRFFVIRMHDSSQEFVLNEFGLTGVVVEQKECQSRAGCPCQTNLAEMDCSAKFCLVPKCIDPIKPIGHCCKVCGGYLTLDIDESFDYLEFQEVVANIVHLYGEDSVAYHIGRLPGNKVQVVVVDKGEYVGTSAEVVHSIEVQTNDRGIQALAQVSGSPLYLARLGVKIAVSAFFTVFIAMGVVYAYYYKTLGVGLQRFQMPSRSVGRGVLSRFNRRTESIVSLTSRRGSTVTIGGGAGATAFRNPLYDSRRGRVQVTESVVEE